MRALSGSVGRGRGCSCLLILVRAHFALAAMAILRYSCACSCRDKCAVSCSRLVIEIVERLKRSRFKEAFEGLAWFGPGIK